jgi:hypothetical protein
VLAQEITKSLGSQFLQVLVTLKRIPVQRLPDFRVEFDPAADGGRHFEPPINHHTRNQIWAALFDAMQATGESHGCEAHARTTAKRRQAVHSPRHQGRIIEIEDVDRSPADARGAAAKPTTMPRQGDYFFKLFRDG